MKNKIYIILLIVSSSVIAQNNLLLNFPFNNNSENKTNISLTIIEQGNIIYGEDRFGNNCGAIYLDGGSFIEIKHNDVFNTINNSFSLTAWVKLDKKTDNTSWLSLICKGDSANETINSPHFRVQVLQGNTLSTVSINTELTEYDTLFNKHKFSYNKWQFFAITYNGQQIKVYQNAKEIWSFNYSGLLNKNTHSIYIGKDIPGKTEFFKGFLDDFKLYNTALSQKEIYNEYQSEQISEFNLDNLCPINQNIYVSENTCSELVSYLPNIQTPCGIVEYKLIKGKKSGSIFNVGSNNIELKANYYDNEEYCGFTINVLDTVSPKIKCNNDTIIFVTDNIFNIKPISPKYIDNCKIDYVKIVSKDTVINTFGTHTIKYEVQDVSLNKSYCSYNITVHNDENQLGVIVYKDTVTVDDEYITVSIFDNAREDGDTISLFYNGKEIVYKEKIRLKTNGEIIRVLKKSNNNENKFIVKAWNTGSRGKNTIRVDFYKGDVSKKLKNKRKLKSFFTQILESEPGLSPAILIK